VFYRTVMKIVVCGARHPSSKLALAKAKELGKQIALNGFEIVSGATVGTTYKAICAAKENGGKTFGVSPAKNKHEHVTKYRYRYPLRNFDKIEFSGKGIPGRNLVLVQKSKVILFVAGSVGTLNEFSIALRKKKLIGMLEGVGGVSSNAKKILKIVGCQKYPKIVYSNDPKKLVKKIKERLGKK